MGSAHELSELRFADVLTFLAVRRRGSVTGAARELRVTPSQVSKAIARLEAHMRLTLLARGPRGVTVSEAGARITPRLEDLVRRVRALDQPEACSALELTVAAPSYLNTAFLPAIVEALPDARVRGIEMPPAFVRAYATENVFELAMTVGAEPLPATWASVRVAEVRKSLYSSPAVAKKLGPQPVAVCALASIPFVSPVYNSNGRFVLGDDGCPLPRGDRTLGHEAASIGVALELAARSGQLVFGPAVAARALVQAGRLVPIHVKGWSLSDPLYVHCNSDRVLARVQKTVLQAVRSEARRSDV